MKNTIKKVAVGTAVLSIVVFTIAIVNLKRNTKSPEKIVDTAISDLSSGKFTILRRGQNRLIQLGRSDPDLVLPKLMSFIENDEAKDGARALAVHVLGGISPKQYQRFLLECAQKSRPRCPDLPTVLRYADSGALEKLDRGERDELEEAYEKLLNEGVNDPNEKKCIGEFLTTVRRIQ